MGSNDIVPRSRLNIIYFIGCLMDANKKSEVAERFIRTPSCQTGGADNNNVQNADNCRRGQRAATNAREWSIAHKNGPRVVPSAPYRTGLVPCGQIVEIMTTAPGDGEPAVWNALSSRLRCYKVAAAAFTGLLYELILYVTRSGMAC